MKTDKYYEFDRNPWKLFPSVETMVAVFGDRHCLVPECKNPSTLVLAGEIREVDMEDLKPEITELIELCKASTGDTGINCVFPVCDTHQDGSELQ